MWHFISNAGLISGFWSSYHCKTFVCSYCHVLSYPCTSVSFIQVTIFLKIFTILDCVSLLLRIILIWCCEVRTALYVKSCIAYGWSCLVSRYIPRYTFSWLVKPMWLIISMYTFLLTPSNLDSNIGEHNINFGGLYRISSQSSWSDSGAICCHCGGSPSS